MLSWYILHNGAAIVVIRALA